MNTEPIQPDEPLDDHLAPAIWEALRTFPSEQGHPTPETDAAVMREAHKTFAGMRHRPFRIHFWPLLAAAACIALAVTLLTRPKAPTVAAIPAPTEDKYALILREVTAVFPEQVKAIIADGGELRIALADRPLDSHTQAVVVELCENQKCTTVITYVGQTVEVGGHIVTVRKDEKDTIVADTSDHHTDNSASGLHITTRTI